MPKNLIKTRWTESIAISLLLPVIGYAIDPADPFFLDYRFPWLILAPIFASLRYGFVCGIASSVLLIGMVSSSFYLGLPEVAFFPKEVIVGLLLLTVISAEFHESWTRKIKLLDYRYNHLKVRMDKFSRSYHLIKGSHYQLEQHLASQAKSLRLSLLDLKKRILSLEKNMGEPLAGVGDHILKILRSHVNVQMAAIYAVNEQKKISAEPVACLGQPRPLPPSDPVIEEALRTGDVASLEMEKTAAGVPGGALVAVPLVDVYQKIWGVIVVNEIPLFALQEATMDVLAVLGGEMGDLIKRRAESHCSDDDGRKAFGNRLRRVLREAKDLKTSAVAIATVISSEELQSKLLAKFQTELRGVDEILVVKNAWDRQVFLMLLPYTDEKGANEFLSRMELSRLSPEPACHCSNGMVLSTGNSDIRVCMWMLDHKTSFEKILPEIDRVCKNEFTDVEIMENQDASIFNTV
jgi:hypothetical protein